MLRRNGLWGWLIFSLNPVDNALRPSVALRSPRLTLCMGR
jgi:hypothetical protein